MKDYTQIGLCYYPSTTILVDDNNEFIISAATDLFENHSTTALLYNSPEDALKFLNNQVPNNLIDRVYTRNDEESSFDSATIKLDFTNIYREIYNHNRFKDITTVVVDYAMPGINGAELCQQLIHRRVKKIMLTGEADNDKAVVLFNDGIIDQFISKSSSDLFEKLQSNIQRFQQKYFWDLSQNALNQLQQTPLSCLSDQTFIKIFNEYAQKAKAIEYYLLDDQGSFLFLDKDANPSWLIVVGEEMMAGYYQFAYYHENVPPTIIKSLEKRSSLLFFPTGETYRPRASEWEDYLYPAKTLNGKEKYYYSFITQPHTHNLEFDKITSYQTYLDTTYQPYFDNYTET